MSDHIQRARDAVDEAMNHHQNAADAHARGDARAVTRAQAAVTRCLRTAQQCFRDIAAAAGEDDINNSKTVQTSSGTGVSNGSDNGRAGSPLLQGDVKGWLDRARVGARR